MPFFAARAKLIGEHGIATRAISSADFRDLFIEDAFRHSGNGIGSEGSARQFNHGADAIDHMITALGEDFLRHAIHHGAGDF